MQQTSNIQVIVADLEYLIPVCQFPAYRSQFVFGVMAPVDFRHKGATSFSV